MNKKNKITALILELMIALVWAIILHLFFKDKNIITVIPLIVFLPLFGFIINGIIGNFIPNSWVERLGVGTVFSSFILSIISIMKLNTLGSEKVIVDLFSWISVRSFEIKFSFMLDHLSAVMILIITGIGSLIHLYSIGYMHGDKSYSRYFSYLNLFIFAMLTLVLGSNLLMMFIGWEGVGLASYLLIGFWFEDDNNAIAGKKAFITNRIGDFGFLIAMFILIASFKSLDYSSLSTASYLGINTNLITFLLFVGAMGKSAQIPLYVWLPDAMAGPTPVSALIHAATMVTAGVYMIVRLNFIFAISPVTMTIVAIIGVTTALFAASIALVQNDIKKVLAYSTVSQLGYMFLAVGVGAFSVGILHLTTHAFFKACLFLGAGSVIHAMSGNQNMREMGGLAKKLKQTAITMALATIAITGVLPFSGFISKDEILWKAFSTKNEVIPFLPTILWIMGVLAAVMTAFYMWRLFFMTFYSGETRTTDKNTLEHIHESPITMTLPLWVLGIFSVVIGYVALPHFIYHGDGFFSLFYNWLSPVVVSSKEKFTSMYHSTSLELVMMFISWGLALVSAFFAFVLYYKKISPLSSSMARHLRPIYKILLNKYYVDELYYSMIRGLLWFSDKILFRTIDDIIIDKIIVQGSARISYYMGSVVRLFQNGNLQYYTLILVMALFTFFAFMVL